LAQLIGIFQTKNALKYFELPSTHFSDSTRNFYGMAIKFASICGEETRIHGRNRETADRNKAAN
jgi:hypothetical protein